MLPQVSEPRAKPTSPAAVAHAGPAEAPLDPWSGFHGFLVVPPNQTSPQARATQRQLGHQHRSAVGQLGDHRRLLRSHLLLERLGAPRRAIAGYGEQVLRAPGDAVQRSPVEAAGDLLIGPLGLTVGQVLGQADHAGQLRIEALEALQVEAGQLD
jgi:hypothetical protein